MTFLLFILGLALLVGGAELLVRGASKLALALGISPLIVGLTVVAFGTSSPELAVSVQAALAGQADLAVGNVVGSNIFNILVILGISAIIIPLNVSKRIIRVEVPLMIAVSVLAYYFAWDGSISRIEGGTLLLALILFLVYLILDHRQTKMEAKDLRVSAAPAKSIEKGGFIWQCGFVVSGLALLILGSDLLVQSATKFAQQLGVSDLVIGLTIVAAGTSLPELVTSIVAGLRGERDIAVGNVLGSNLFNLLGVLGTAAFVSDTDIVVAVSMLQVDLPVMLVASLVCLPVFISGGRISRIEGSFFLFSYIGFIVYRVTSLS